MPKVRKFTRRRWFVIAGALLGALLVMWIASSFVIRWSVPEPAFEVIEQRDGYEIRRYEAYAVAQVSVAGTYGSAWQEGFRILFDYISGANLRQPVEITTIRGETDVASDEVAMTAPVLFEDEHRDGQVVSFILPPGMVASAAPRPENPRIQLRDMPEQRVAVRTFRGRGSEGSFTREREWLRAALLRDGSYLLSSFRFAQYDPPGTFWLLRRNEVHVTVKP